MNVFEQYRRRIDEALAELAGAGALPRDLDTGGVSVTPPRDPDRGDLATNAALALARQARRPPRALAETIAGALARLPGVESAVAAGPGFVNLTLDASMRGRIVAAAAAAGAGYGRSRLGAGRRVNVEYVSANPTGPMHIGHARGAVFGDALANLLEWTGHAVTREYYVNDAGAQVDALARSVHRRYREALGDDPGPAPPGLYPGAYLKPVGEALAARDGARWRDADPGEWLPVCRDAALDAMMTTIRDDLAALGVRMDRFSSERELIDRGDVAGAIEWLAARGLVYEGVLEPPRGKPPPEDWEPRPQTLFRASRFGDDTDRPLRKSDGGYTYFASDIAYHRDKFRRGFAETIDVWGADHGGYVKRMKAAVAAVTEGKGRLDVKICQLVNLMEDGAPTKMSKRAGAFVALRDAVDSVGRDVLRFVMLTRRNDAPLDFDLARVTERSRDNPVFYVQYAHARIRSVQRHAQAQGMDGAAGEDDLRRLEAPEERALIRHVADWPRRVEEAALAHEPHRVAFALQELAASFHALWNRGNEDEGLRFVLPDDPSLCRARLAMLGAARSAIASGLAIVGVEPAEEMR